MNISVELGDEITDVDLVVSTSWYDMRLKSIKPRFGKGFEIRTYNFESLFKRLFSETLNPFK